MQISSSRLGGSGMDLRRSIAPNLGMCLTEIELRYCLALLLARTPSANGNRAVGPPGNMGSAVMHVGQYMPCLLWLPSNSNTLSPM